MEASKSIFEISLDWIISNNSEAENKEFKMNFCLKKIKYLQRLRHYRAMFRVIIVSTIILLLYSRARLL